MIFEILLSLLGFPGEIVIEDNDKKTYRVRDGMPYLQEGERVQIDRLAPLGWYYKWLQSYGEKYDVKWGIRNENFEAYKAALSAAISDLLEEYARDIAYLEQLILVEGPIPLSRILHHLQKYLLVMPATYNIINDIEIKNSKGCQILDYMTSYSTGVPVINDVVQRIILRLRGVFLKQCMSWMIYGELEDPGAEFFISSSKLLDNNHKINKNNDYVNKTKISNNTNIFDWSSSYKLRLEYLPETHLSPRMASKVLFAGKAVKLLQTSTDSANIISTGNTKDIFQYLATGHQIFDQMQDSKIQMKNTSQSNGKIQNEETKFEDKNLDQLENIIKNVKLAYNTQFNSCGYKSTEVDRFIKKFHEILSQPDLAIELLESLVDDINETISSRLWILLRDEHPFSQCLLCIRNTYLMGRGELYQAIFDGIMNITTKSANELTAPDHLLTLDVVRDAAKIVGLDEDLFSSIFRLSIRSPNAVVTDFSNYNKEIYLCGSAVCSPNSNYIRKGYLSLCNQNINNKLMHLKLWSSKFLKTTENIKTSFATNEKVDIKINSSSNYENIGNYLRGAIWLVDPRYIVKGFVFSSSFTCNWTSVLSNVTKKQITSAGADGICLGSISCVLHNDRQGIHTIGSDRLGIDIPGSISIVVTFYAVNKANQANKSSTKYIANLFIAGKDSSRLSRLDNASVDSISQNTKYHKFDSLDILAETEFEIDIGGADNDFELPVRSGISPLVLEVEYGREMKPSVGPSTPISPGVSSLVVVYSLRARLKERSKLEKTSAADEKWDLTIPFDLTNYSKLSGGLSQIGIVGSGLCFEEPSVDTPIDDAEGKKNFDITVTSMAFEGKGALATYPVASPFTSTRYPDTFLRLESELKGLKYWMNLKLQLEIPSIFRVIFDSEALGKYERVFSTLVNVRLLVHELERLWMARSRLSSDRLFCHLRHSMHFFISNLLYYLQVDVIDSEFCLLKDHMATASNFQDVLMAHRNFLSSVLRLSLVDNLTVKEGIERVFHVCLRFIAVCRLLHQQEDLVIGKTTNEKIQPIVIPHEEIEAIRKDFFSQISYLFAIMRKVESKGFMFRLDFNSYLSNIVADIKL